MQVVPDGWMPVEERLQHDLCEPQPDANSVTIVVVLDVLAPVHHRRGRLSFLLRDEVVDLLLAPIDLARRREDKDDVVTNRLNEWRLLDGKSIREFHQHFRTTGFG